MSLGFFFLCADAHQEKCLGSFQRQLGGPPRLINASFQCLEFGVVGKKNERARNGTRGNFSATCTSWEIHNTHTPTESIQQQRCMWYTDSLTDFSLSSAQRLCFRVHVPRAWAVAAGSRSDAVCEGRTWISNLAKNSLRAHKNAGGTT